MPDVTSKLSDEHELILRYSVLLESLLTSVHESRDPLKPWFWRDLESIVDFIREYADAYHHAKEETILFKFMARPGVLEQGDPVPQLCDEHEIGRRNVKDLLAAIRRQDLKAAFQHGMDWVELIRAHIEKEDAVAFRMAEDGIPDADKAEILRIYEGVEGEMRGETLQARYERLLDEITSRSG